MIALLAGGASRAWCGLSAKDIRIALRKPVSPDIGALHGSFQVLPTPSPCSVRRRFPENLRSRRSRGLSGTAHRGDGKIRRANSATGRVLNLQRRPRSQFRNPFEQRDASIDEEQHPCPLKTSAES